ncbi:MAG: cytidine deaminase [Bdellovibrionales bacterium]|nr:cytidine deaminase [Bdellovibrionales bacterium]
MMKNLTRVPASLKKLYAVAKKARRNAHVPHSGCQVGAAIRLANGKVYPGCNVENASYGGTVCAERGALQTAVCAEGKIKVKEILVVTDASPPWMPCGLCRQVISEFVADAPGGDIAIYSTNLKGEMLATTFAKLYPGLFSPAELKAAQRKKKR